MKKAALTALAALAAMAATASPALAGQMMMEQSYVTPYQHVSLYRANELQIDIFGTYVFEDDDNGRLFGRDDGTWGGGIGVNYFFTRHFGIGVEGMLFDTDGDTLGSTAFNLFLRAPLGDSGFAVYGIAGAGVVFNADDLDRDDFEDARDRFDDDRDSRSGDDVIFAGHVGGGLEYRCTENFGVFVEGRYTFVDLSDADYASARAGIRIAF